jgi:hypothetical protein
MEVASAPTYASILKKGLKWAPVTVHSFLLKSHRKNSLIDSSYRSTTEGPDTLQPRIEGSRRDQILLESTIGLLDVLPFTFDF